MASKRRHQEEELESDGSHLKWPRVLSYSFHGAVAHRDYTVAWICALPLELAASRAMLDEEHPVPPNQIGDDNTYVLGRIGEHDVVMVCLPGQYGTNNAAIVATNLKRSFPSVRCALMVGIGGGCPTQADLCLGDVVVGTRVMQYDMGKVVAGWHFLEIADAKTPARLLNSAVSILRSKHAPHRSSKQMASILRSRLPDLSRPTCADRLFQASYEHPLGAPTCDGCEMGMLQPRGVRPSDEPNIHYGVIASGNRVIKNGKMRDEIAQRHSALCFEMEAAGMMDTLQCLPIRGICDYSDSHKNKEWQAYAAATAAAYGRELLEQLPPSSLADNDPRYPTLYSNISREPDIVGTQPADSALERRHRLIESLNFAQIDARKTTIRAAHAKTCRWLLQTATYRNWLDSSKLSENHGFLWMRGKAGAGKSTLMKFLCSASKKSDKPGHALTASFFFNARGDYLEKSIIGMYRSLLMQLLKGFSDLQSILDDTDIIPQGQQDCPDLNVLKEIFERALIALGPRSLTCFIDALDECDEQEVRDMVQFFEDLAETTTNDGIKLRICFSSRPYPYISIRKGILFTLEDEPGHAEDLAQYVKSKLTIDDPLILADLQTEILGKASGIFLWIVLAVDILNRENDDGGLALRTKLAKIPAKLSDLFKSMLMRDQKSPERLLLCVLWILCAKRPLTPAEFRHALWVGLLDQSLRGKDTQVDSEVPDVTNMNACIKLVTSSSKGLAEITKSKQPTVQFVHESVRDYLVKERGLLDLWPELGFEWETLGHERLRRCCAAYLDLEGIRTTVNQVEGEIDRDALVQKYTLLEYASQQILHHADTAALVSPQDEFLSRFFAGPSGIKVLNLFERHKTRTYGLAATPLYILADKGLGNLVRRRMKIEPTAHCPNEEYRYPFFAALAGGHKDTVAALLQLPSVHCDGVDITEGFKYRKDLERYKGRTPLTWAAQEGKLGLAKALAQDDVNAQDRDGSTPLSRASRNGHEDIVKLLIARGADPRGYNSSGSTALIKASEEGHERVVQTLIEAAAGVDSRVLYSKWTALICASLYGHERVVWRLIAAGADVNIRDATGWTALLYASNREHESVVQHLIAGGADVNARSSDGMTALILASSLGHEATVRLLLSSGAHVNVQDSQGRTALSLASERGHESVAQLLVDNGADGGHNYRDDHL